MDGALSLAALALNEVIARQKAEEKSSGLESRLDEREKFLSLVSHDLRNPLSALKFGAQMIRRKPEDPELCRTMATRMIDAVSRAERMIGDLLDANRLRAGMSIPIELFPCDLRSVLQHTCDSLSVVHEGRYKLVAEYPVSGSFDAEAIRRCVENLVNNAIKYGASDMPVTISLERHDGKARISVHNFGNPIAPADQAVMFQWYGRTQSAEKSGKSGWGLGLMLVQGIAQAHGGTVFVSSAPEAGTLFSIDLPIVQN